MTIKFEYNVNFVVEASNEAEAFDLWSDAVLGKSDWITPTISPVRDENYYAYSGIKPKGKS